MSATVSKKVESISSQGSSVLSLSRKPTQNFAATSKDPDVSRQADNLSKKRRDSLHKRYKEATKKSQEIFARLNVSLLNTTFDSSIVGKQSGLFIIPSASAESGSNRETPQQSPAKQQFSKSIKAKSTPVQNENEESGNDEDDGRNRSEKKFVERPAAELSSLRRVDGGERRRSTEIERRRESDTERRRESDLDRRRERESDAERQRDYEHGWRNGRRPYSRSSEQADWKYKDFVKMSFVHLMFYTKDCLLGMNLILINIGNSNVRGEMEHDDRIREQVNEEMIIGK